MYIGNQDIDEMLDDKYVFRMVFTYPPGCVPKAVPITTAVRKENVLTFYFESIAREEDLAKIIKLANGDYVNSCPHITDRCGGVKFEKQIKDPLTKQWKVLDD
jgi:hypothetical protein